MELPKKYHQLAVGNKVKVNGIVYTINEKIAHKAKDEHHSDQTRYELSDGMILEYDWSWRFFSIEEKSFLGFKFYSSKLIKIKDIGKVKK